MTLPPILARLLVHSGIPRLWPTLDRRLPGGVDALRYWSDRLLASPLSQLEKLAATLDADAPEVLDLASGAPRFDLVPSAHTRLTAARRGWPPVSGLPELRAAIAEKLLEENQLAFSPQDDILVTAGALGGAQTVFDAFVNRGDGVALLDPCSPLYSLLARTRGARIRWVRTRTDEGRLRLRFDDLAQGLRGARLLVLTNPASPTGGVLSPEDLELISWWAARNDTLILSDEVFERFVYDEETVSMGVLPRARQRTITLGSVSKSHALAWARVGWVAASRPLARACIATAALRTPFVSTLSQMIACEALRARNPAFETVLRQFDGRRRHVFDRLRALGLDPVWPAGGFFTWVQAPTPWRSGRDLADALLETRRVRVVPGDLFGPSGTGFIRISHITDDGRLDEGLSRLGELLKGERQASRQLRRVG